MANITPVNDLGGAGVPKRYRVRVRSATAQATTGQTDWVRVPKWAKYAVCYFNVTATAGNTPIFLPSLKTVAPQANDSVPQVDTNAVYLSAVSTTGITSTGLTVIHVGPGVTGIADDVVGAAGGGNESINAVLPGLLGFTVLNDRTTGDETYTYTVDVEFSA